MVIKDFSGGLVTRLHPSLLQSSQAVKYTNCDNTAGILRPVGRDIVVNDPIHKYYTWYKGTIVDSQYYTSWAEYDNKLYDSHGKVTLPDMSVHDAYLDKPTANISITNDITTGTTYQVKYRYTFYDEETGVESPPSDITYAKFSDGLTVVTLGLPSSSYKKRVYRIGGSLSEYHLVKETYNTSMIDNLHDEDIAGNLSLTTVDIIRMPIGTSYICIHKASLFAAKGNKLYFSDVSMPHSFKEINSIKFEEYITGLGSTQHGLLVFTSSSTYIITGSSPSTFVRYLLDNEIGCETHSSIAYFKGTLVWASKEGIATSNGGRVKIISRSRLGSVHNTFGIVLSAAVVDSMYVAEVKDGLLVVDYRYGLHFRFIERKGTLSSNNGLLYVRDNQDHKLYNVQLTGDLVYNETDALTMHYKSGILAPPNSRYSELKHFKDFYIAYKGNIHLIVYLDDTVILDKQLSSNEVDVFNAKSLGNRDGYGLQLEIIGTGEVYEIDFNAVGRKNGK